MLGPELDVHNRAKRVAYMHNMTRELTNPDEIAAVLPKVQEALDELVEAFMAYEAWDRARKN